MISMSFSSAAAMIAIRKLRRETTPEYVPSMVGLLDAHQQQLGVSCVESHIWLWIWNAQQYVCDCQGIGFYHCLWMCCICLESPSQLVWRLATWCCCYVCLRYIYLLDFLWNLDSELVFGCWGACRCFIDQEFQVGVSVYCTSATFPLWCFKEFVLLCVDGKGDGIVLDHDVQGFVGMCTIVPFKN